MVRWLNLIIIHRFKAFDCTTIAYINLAILYLTMQMPVYYS
jgi:hypothetical protein